ncbi:hypothetical protein Taro_043268 [Colocasia esculenta]|uniref:Cytochrome b5 heme-binding domain-containing protein n=1 Tax=Colocasia esculenta TaxID=4460 RepID=A0A843WQY7_COLES|nr:hypothetical protein [Colocasia esculenta]
MAAREETHNAPSARTITTEELRRHNSASDLWIAINGKVCDVTAWADHHPGGDLPLLIFAGQDVTDAFLAYHPASAWPLLDRYLVARLSDHRVSDLSRDYRRLAGEFARRGLFDSRGHGAVAVLCLVLLLLAAAVCGVVYTRSPAVHALSGALVGFLWIQAAFVGHDSGHYWVMPTGGLTRLAQLLAGNCLMGISIAWWKRNHNAHHIACNSLDFDPDLQHMPLFAVSPDLFRSLTSFYYRRKMAFDAVARLLVSYQHWTFYPVMCVARVNLFAQSILFLLSGEKVPGRWQEILGLTVFWVWFPLLVSYLPTWGERATFVMASFAVSGILHVQLCLSHFSSPVYVGRPAANDWFQNQTVGTLDIACSPWMDWFHGGLQFQLEHHLFPRLPRCQLRRVAPRVRALCVKHGLPNSTASFWEANARTIATLRAAALQARGGANPAPKNLLWEAVNAYG